MANARGGRAYGVIHSCGLCVLLAAVALAQDISPGSRYYGRDGVYVPQDATGYKTYVYKDRRYGYQPSYLEPGYRGPTRAPEDRFLYGVSEIICAATTNINIQRQTDTSYTIIINYKLCKFEEHLIEVINYSMFYCNFDCKSNNFLKTIC